MPAASSTSVSEPRAESSASTEGPRLRHRMAGATAGATVAAFGVAWREAASSAAEVSWLQLFPSAVGLLWPLVIVVGVSVGVGFFTLHPQGPAALWRSLPRSAAHRWLALLMGPSVLLFVYLTSRASLLVLGAGWPAATTGVAMALGAGGLGVAFVLMTRLAAALLGARFMAPRLELGALLSLIAFALGLGGLLALGETSGGSRPWQVFGVLRREELDLAPAWSLVGMALGAYLGASLVRRHVAWMGVALLPAAGFIAAFRMDADTGLAWERSRGVAAQVLPLARRLTDSDGDGFARAFGGGDCDDRNPNIFPGAVDIPGNQIDEDCSGSDATIVVPEEPAEASADDAPIAASIPERANVVLITIDTLRWDLGYMGNPRPLSPRLDELAARSTVFERSYSLASYTSKSLGPMLIGKYPSETRRDWSHFDRFPKEEQFVQERLQAAGIRTVSVQGYWYFSRPGYGYERGFDILDTEAVPKVILIEGDRRVNSDAISDAAIRQLEDPAMADQQFYLWAHYIDPHAEYVRHEAFDFGKDERARYDGEVAFVDHHVGRVLDAIEQSPSKDRTIIIVTSDHGEAFGEHGLIRHGFEVWEELVRVPLIVHVPGAPPRRVPARRSILDVVPTILEAMGQPRPRVEDAEKDDPNFVRGESLLADVVATQDSPPRERPVLVDMPEAPNNKERLAFYDGPYKIILSHGRVLGVYDLDEDPGEKRNLKDDRELTERLLGKHQALQQSLRKFSPRR